MPLTLTLTANILYAKITIPEFEMKMLSTKPSNEVKTTRITKLRILVTYALTANILYAKILIPEK